MSKSNIEIVTFKKDDVVRFIPNTPEYKNIIKFFKFEVDKCYTVSKVIKDHVFIEELGLYFYSRLFELPEDLF